MTRALLILLLLWPFCTLGAQDTLATGHSGIPRLTLKTNATTLLNIFKPSAMITADLRLAPRWSMDIGAGAFLVSSFFADKPGEHYYGLRARAGMKYFFSLQPDVSWHLGMEAKYNQVQHAYWGRVLRQGGQFEQILLIDRRVKSIGAALRIGVQLYLGRHKRMLVDFYTGFGFVTNNVIEKNLPPDAERLFDEVFQTFRDDYQYPTGRRTIPDFLLGIHMGYLFW